MLTKTANIFNHFIIILITSMIMPTLVSGMSQSPDTPAKYRQNHLKSNIQSQNFTVGDFKIHWVNNEQQTSILVNHKESTGQKLPWSSIKDTNFLTAQNVETKVEENRGTFNVRQEIKECLAHQTVDKIYKRQGQLVIEGKLLDKSGQNKTEYKFIFDQVRPYHLQFRAQAFNKAYNQLVMKHSSNKQEHFYGFGEQFTHVDLKGHKVPVITQEGGIGRGRKPITSLMNMVAKGSGGDAFHPIYRFPNTSAVKTGAYFSKIQNILYSI